MPKNLDLKVSIDVVSDEDVILYGAQYLQETQFLYRWFSRYVFAAILVDKNNIAFSLTPFVRPPAFVHFTIVICVSRDWLQTTY